MLTELEKVKNKLCDEQSQLFQKLYKLDDVLVGNVRFKDISDEQYQLMWMQRNAMKMYIDILQLRINELQDRIKEIKEVK